MFRLDVLHRSIREIPELFRLASVQSLRDRERRIHADDAGIEVEFGHALEAARWALFDTYSAAFAVIDENFVHPVGARWTGDARLGTNEVTVVACVAGSATEAATGFFDGLLF